MLQSFSQNLLLANEGYEYHIRFLLGSTMRVYKTKSYIITNEGIVYLPRYIDNENWDFSCKVPFKMSDLEIDEKKLVPEIENIETTQPDLNIEPKFQLCSDAFKPPTKAELQIMFSAENMKKIFSFLNIDEKVETPKYF
jgi:hypothetical protein